MKRTIIFGDIHGCFDELRDLCDAAAVADGDLLVSVGDLVDRGPQPAEVVRFFQSRPGAVVLMGNHERKHVRGVLSYAQEITRLQMDAGYAEAVEWMRGLPYFFETDAVRVVHAAMVPGRPLREQAEEVLAGTTSGEAALRAEIPEGYWHERYTDPVPVVFGHHVVGPEPLIRDGLVYGIDTGACHGMRLTALSVPDYRIHSVPARADHWHAVKREWQAKVLRTRPWGSMTWAEIEETAAERARGAAPDAATFLSSVRAWAAATAALVPALLSRVGEIAEELRGAHGQAGFAKAAAAHPAKPLLFQHARGRLDRSAIEVRCATPERTIELARVLGVPAPAPFPE